MEVYRLWRNYRPGDFGEPIWAEAGKRRLRPMMMTWHRLQSNQSTITICLQKPVPQVRSELESKPLILTLEEEKGGY